MPVGKYKTDRNYSVLFIRQIQPCSIILLKTALLIKITLLKSFADIQMNKLVCWDK